MTSDAGQQRYPQTFPSRKHLAPFALQTKANVGSYIFTCRNHEVKVDTNTLSCSSVGIAFLVRGRQTQWPDAELYTFVIGCFPRYY